MNKSTIGDIDLKGKRCFVRVDFNVPFNDEQEITDDSRMVGALPTINHLIKDGAKVILASHMGRPKGERNPEYSLKLVLERLKALIGKDVIFVDDCIGEEVNATIASMKEGDVLLLENVRFYKEETANDENFSKQLAESIDVFVNDAFGAAHRAHASTAGIARFVGVSVAGLLMEKEINYFNKAVANPERPLVGILGGAKAEGKIEVLNKLAEKLDKVIISGGLAFTFMKAMGAEVGNSLVSNDLIDKAKEIITKMDKLNVEYFFPVDFVVAKEFKADAATQLVSATAIPSDSMALDIGPESSKLFADALQDAKTIVWNGPMGAFEMEAFSKGTYNLVDAVTKTGALTIIGGGDSGVAVKNAGAVDKISYISTGGGAFLELLEGKTLPGIECLNEK
ncbi:MAG: phosphoglycerate kinase [Nitrospinae bacterium]|nr:phosphoglycerate kinase [Nitrospinota bacterium]